MNEPTETEDRLHEAVTRFKTSLAEVVESSRPVLEAFAQAIRNAAAGLSDWVNTPGMQRWIAHNRDLFTDEQRHALRRPYWRGVVRRNSRYRRGTSR